MKNYLKHNDYSGSVEFSTCDTIFYGKIIGIDDLVSYEAQSLEELKSAFNKAVDDYIEEKEDLGLFLLMQEADRIDIVREEDVMKVLDQIKRK